jgi:hypothetical protein
MTTIEFITALFCQVDDQMPGISKHPDARLWPVRWSPWGCCMRSKGWGIARSIVG